MPHDDQLVGSSTAFPNYKNRCPCSGLKNGYIEDGNIDPSSTHWEICRTTAQWQHDESSETCPLCWLVWTGLQMFMKELKFVPGSQEIGEEFYQLQIVLRVPKVARAGAVSVSYLPKAGFKADEKIYYRWKSKTWEWKLNTEYTAWPWSLFPVVQVKQDVQRRVISQIRVWLAECIANHPKSCGVLAPNRLPIWTPTRLIEIGDNYRRLRLVETKGRPTTYTALSYCWGPKEMKIVNEEIYASSLRRIAWKRLPLIHRDAIRLTHSLDIRHIWIDAACIIQDDLKDWELEANLMGEVYANAVLTISAAHATNPNEQLLRPPRKAETVKYGDRGRMSEPRNLLGYRQIDHGPLSFQDPRSRITWPAFNRAWTLQERLLATRVVHFAPQEIVWECKTHIQCECRGVEQKESLKNSFHAAERSPFDEGHTKVHIAAALWRSIILEASGRKLKHDSDRLIANAGLAKYFHSQSPSLGQYLAGIWEADLLHGLSWEVNTTSASKRTATYVAPSWSWCCLSGCEVWYDSVIDWETCTYHATCISASTTPKSPSIDPEGFGAVLDGQITLSAPTLVLVYDATRTTDPLKNIAGLDCQSQFAFDVRPAWNSPSTSSTSPATHSKTSDVQNGDVLTIVFLWSCVNDDLNRVTAIALRKAANVTNRPKSVNTARYKLYNRVGLLFAYPTKITKAKTQELVDRIGNMQVEQVVIV